MSFLNKFIKSFLIFEKKELKKKFSLVEYFIKNINLIDYFFFIFDKNKYNPIKSIDFKNYININKKKWKNNKINNLKSNNSILVETFINHAAYTLSNIVTSAYLNNIYNMKMVGLIRNYDLKSEVIFRSFGVRNFIYFKNPNIFYRVKYILKSLKILSNQKDFKRVNKLKYKNIDVGLTAYDTYIRYLGIPTLEKINCEFIVFFAEALYSCDFFINEFNKNHEIKKSVQGETQFSPLNILFQVSLKNKIEVFSRSGLESFTLRKYTNWKQRYSYRGSISQKLFNEVFKKNKKKSINYIKKIYKNKIKINMFGLDDVVLGLSNKKLTFVTKDKLLKKFRWKNKKIVVFFLSHLLDGNFNFGFRKNFKDIYSSTKFIIEKISKVNQVNWIIKKHPNHDHFKSKIDFDKEIINLEKKFNHIKLLPENIDPSSLLKIADTALTASGSVGVEYPAFGIRSIFYEKSYYSNLNFLNYAKSKKNLLFELQNIHKSQKLKKLFIEKCQVYLFIKDILIKSESSLIPEYIPSRKINENFFWKRALKKVKMFKFSKDLFYSMLQKQIKYNLRHTINFNFTKLSKKKYNDFYD